MREVVMDNTEDFIDRSLRAKRHRAETKFSSETFKPLDSIFNLLPHVHHDELNRNNWSFNGMESLFIH